MQYTLLGNSDLSVSRICLGCMSFGDPSAGPRAWTLMESDSRAVIQAALSLGINFFDTAAAYQNGISETYLGRALHDFSQRQQIVVATKFLPRTKAQIAAGIDAKTHIRQSLTQSLQRLGMDYVDLYICHKWDETAPLYDIMAGLNDVVRAGMARYIGISNCFAWQLCKANALAQKEGFAPFISVQNHYNLVFREEEREMVPLCRADNIAMTPYSPLASGRLCRMPGSQTQRLQQDDYARGKYDATAAQDAKIILRTSQLARQHDVSMTQIALAWLLKQTAAPVVGATSARQLADIAAATTITLTQQECTFLQESYVPHALVGMMAEPSEKAS